ncbi:GrpB family protein [Fulvivirga sp.]|uniref:GrpB family protein n=1 Tax=Fulvivirga sp. TaxID=1931237 RepID=UPI0032EA91E8
MLIQEYELQWDQDFRKIKLEIEKGLIGLNISIEHIGSTSIPNLAAKSIIDIDLIYGTDTDFNKVKSGLSQIGYLHNGNQGILNREVFKRNAGLSKNEILDNIKHHLYVCPIDSEELNRHLLFRNYLRTNEWARLKYQELKYELAEKAGQNKQRYAELKELNAKEFINSIVEKSKISSS